MGENKIIIYTASDGHTKIEYRLRPKSNRFTRVLQKSAKHKIHFAVQGHTAAELIVERADAEKDFMGLLTFKNLDKKGGKDETEI